DLLPFLAATFFIDLPVPAGNVTGGWPGNVPRPFKPSCRLEERMIGEIVMLANAIFMCQRAFGAWCAETAGFHRTRFEPGLPPGIPRPRHPGPGDSWSGGCAA